MNIVRIAVVGKKEKRTKSKPPEAFVFIERVQEASPLRNEFLKYTGDGLSGLPFKDFYSVLWYEKEQEYTSILWQTVSRLAELGIKSARIQHPRHMDDTVVDLPDTNAKSFARHLMSHVLRRKGIRTLILSFKKGDALLPKLMESALKEIRKEKHTKDFFERERRRKTST